MITWKEVTDIIQELEPDVEYQLPPRVSCLRCGKMFQPTEDTGMRYNAHFGVFFFYCEEHDT